VNSERWQEVKKVLEVALEREPAERSEYLDKACADPSLRREVESLIAAHDHAGSSFMESSPVKSAPLVPGAKLGPYEIVAPLGAGGMESCIGRVTAVSNATSRSKCLTPVCWRMNPRAGASEEKPWHSPN